MTTNTYVPDPLREREFLQVLDMRVVVWVRPGEPSKATVVIDPGDLDTLLAKASQGSDYYEDGPEVCTCLDGYDDGWDDGYRSALEAVEQYAKEAV